MKRIFSLVCILATLIVTISSAGCNSSSAGDETTELKSRVTTLDQKVVSLSNQVAKLQTENKTLRAKVGENTAREVTVYFIKFGQPDFTLVPEKRLVSAGSNPIRAALEELVKGPYYNSNVDRVLPKGADLLGMRLEKGRAIVDFNAATRDNLNMGSTGEALVLQAIVQTVLEFPEVDEVQILIEGKAGETLGGHVLLDQVFKRNGQVGPL